MEIDKKFWSFDEWQKYCDAGLVLSHEQIDEFGAAMLKAGAVEPLTNYPIPAGELNQGSNWREGLLWRGVNSRTRAVMMVIEKLLEQPHDPRIYAAEAVTSFALRLRGLYPRFLGSEFTDDPLRRSHMFPVPFEDLTALSFESGIFDVVSTNEVLEHVPSIDRSLSEIARVLRPGGWHIGTHPFLFMNEKSQVKAELKDGSLIFHMEPEYHGNPMSDQGSLVFELPGWDILSRARNAGFSEAHMRFVLSERHACLSMDIGGVFVLCCRK